MAKKRVLPAILCVALLAAAGWYAARALTIHPAHFSAPSSISVRLTRFCGSSPVNLELRGQWSVKTEAGVILLSGSDFRGVLAPDPTGLLLGARLLGRSPCILATRGDGGIRLGDRAYTGALRVEALRGRSGLPQDLDIVLELPLEDYVLGVVCGEMPSSAPGIAEALKAQAVASRTWALWKTRNSSRPLRDTTADQKFIGVDFETRAARQAVADTRGMVLSYKGDLIPTFFHADCGGRTSDSYSVGFTHREWPPLQGVEDPDCERPFRWSRPVEAATLDGFARTHGLGDWIGHLEASSRDAGGRWLEAKLVGPSARGPFPGEDLRTGFSVPSALWQKLSVRADGSLVVSGAGHGHGVGLCQQGALRAAKKGRIHSDILEHYYPGSVVSILGR